MADQLKHVIPSGVNVVPIAMHFMSGAIDVIPSVIYMIHNAIEFAMHVIPSGMVAALVLKHCQVITSHDWRHKTLSLPV